MNKKTQTAVASIVIGCSVLGGVKYYQYNVEAKEKEALRIEQENKKRVKIEDYYDIKSSKSSNPISQKNFERLSKFKESVTEDWGNPGVRDDILTRFDIVTNQDLEIQKVALNIDPYSFVSMYESTYLDEKEGVFQNWEPACEDVKNRIALNADKIDDFMTKEKFDVMELEWGLFVPDISYRLPRIKVEYVKLDKKSFVKFTYRGTSNYEDKEKNRYFIVEEKNEKESKQLKEVSDKVLISKIEKKSSPKIEGDYNIGFSLETSKAGDFKNIAGSGTGYLTGNEFGAEDLRVNFIIEEDMYKALLQGDNVSTEAKRLISSMEGLMCKDLDFCRHKDLYRKKKY